MLEHIRDITPERLGVPLSQVYRMLLAVPEGLRVWSLMPVGRPAETPQRPRKSDPADAVHHNRYGNRARQDAP